MIETEPKEMMSESLKDSFDGQQNQFDISSIATAIFFDKNIDGLLTVLKGISWKNEKLTVSVSARCSDIYSLFNKIRIDKAFVYSHMRIEHLNSYQDVCLSEYVLKKIKIHSINNDDQTCVCDIKFVTHTKTTL